MMLYGRVRVFSKPGNSRNKMGITNLESLASHGNVAGRDAILKIIESGLQATDPYSNVKRLVRIDGNHLIVGQDEFEPDGDPASGDAVFKLDDLDHIYVVGAGKGVQRAAQALEDVLGDHLTGGRIIDKKGAPVVLRRIGVTLGAHPVPDEDCVRGCREILALTEKLTEKDLVFTLGASGFSALLTHPVPGVSLEDVQKTVYMMQIERGAPTSDLSPIRNHLDLLKAGRLSAHIHPAQAIHIMAKPPGGYEQLIQHSYWFHTLPDRSTFEDAILALKKWDAWDEIPSSVRDHLLRAEPQFETVKPEEYQKLRFRIFGVLPGEEGLWTTPRQTAEALGYKAVLLATDLRMEASEAGRFIGTVARTIEKEGFPFKPPVALFTSGELVVTVGKENGVGGRNQEYSLAAGIEIAGSKRIVVAAVDTDGTDGPGAQYLENAEDAARIPTLAGAVVDGYTIHRAREKNLDVAKVLKSHNTTPLLLELDDGILATQNPGLRDLGVVLVTR
jgi:glycerate 2-kinase